MKSLNAALVLFILFLIFPVAGMAQSTPGATVKAFYKWYVHALKHNVDEPLRSDSVRGRRFVTASLRRKIAKVMASEEVIDADYFISAQDLDDNWENKVVIQKVSINGQTAIVTAVLPSKMVGDQRLKISMKKEAGLWKIDMVNDNDLKP